MTLAADESPFNMKETLLYLMSFYSSHEFEGEDELEKAAAKYFASKKAQNLSTTVKANEAEVKTDAPAVIDKPKINPDQNQNIPREPAQIEHPPAVEVTVKESEKFNNKDGKRVDYDVAKDFEIFESKHRSLDMLLSMTIYFLVFLTFCCLYSYFKMLRRRSKSRHTM